jgi:hypothetical protein
LLESVDGGDMVLILTTERKREDTGDRGEKKMRG